MSKYPKHKFDLDDVTLWTLCVALIVAFWALVNIISIIGADR